MATGAAWLKGRNSQGEREEQNILTGKEKENTYLTLTGLLMEGLILTVGPGHLPVNYVYPTGA
jgi:hypothetical protein